MGNERDSKKCNNRESGAKTTTPLEFFLREALVKLLGFARFGKTQSRMGCYFKRHESPRSTGRKLALGGVDNVEEIPTNSEQVLDLTMDGQQVLRVGNRFDRRFNTSHKGDCRRKGPDPRCALEAAGHLAV